MSCSSKGCPIRVTDLGWGPKSSHFLVRDVSFALDAGDRLAIVGPNGAGKTTLLRCLYRGVSPLEGRVEVDGQDIWSMSARQVARRVAVVLQEMPGDFPFTVRDVVMMGRVPWREGLSGWNDQDRAEAEHALDHLDLLRLANQPDLDPLGRRKAACSGGTCTGPEAGDPDSRRADQPSGHRSPARNPRSAGRAQSDDHHDVARHQSGGRIRKPCRSDAWRPNERLRGAGGGSDRTGIVRNLRRARRAPAGGRSSRAAVFLSPLH